MKELSTKDYMKIFDFCCKYPSSKTAKMFRDATLIGGGQFFIENSSIYIKHEDAYVYCFKVDRIIGGMK